MKSAMKRRLARLEVQAECYLDKIEEEAEMERESPKVKLRTFAEIQAAGRGPTADEVMAAIRQKGPRELARIMREIARQPRCLPSGERINSFKAHRDLEKLK